MESRLALVFLTVVCLQLCKGSWMEHTARQWTVCGDWTPYEEGKCVKILNATGSKNQAEAEMVCQSSYSKLVRVKDSKDQRFLQQFLFRDSKLVENVWLGLKKSVLNSEFEWNDGSKMSFNNWAHQNATENNYSCVAVASGYGVNEEGVWVNVQCEQNNTVVCERGLVSMNTSDITFTRNASGQGVVQHETEENILTKAEKECNEKFGLLKQASLQTRELLKEATEKLTAGIDHVNIELERQIDSQIPEPHINKNQSPKAGLANLFVESPCGDWTPYNNEKCIKLVVHAGLQTKEDGEIICNGFAEEFHDDVIPKLVTIKTHEMQQFLQKLLFEDLDYLANVWLGLQSGKDDVFHWNDGTDLFFTNWVEESGTGREHQCAQMESGEGSHERGKWVGANCTKKNVVVCERTQPWSLATLQDILLSLKLEIANNKEESKRRLNSAKNESEQKLSDAKKEAEQNLHNAEKEFERKLNDVKMEAIQNLDDTKNQSEQKIHDAKMEAEQKVNNTRTEMEQKLNQMITEANWKIESLKQNLVPTGFIYVQLPDQDPPTTLWPGTSWNDVGSKYAGLFFRVEGGDAAPFGQLQGDDTRRLAQVYYAGISDTEGDPEVPSDGSWSKHAYTGRDGGGQRYGLKFRLTKGEVRPRNKSVKIWQRIK